MQVRQWDPRPWYGGGIMHAKLWIADAAAVYVGSSNPDWKSLTQVKELGVVSRVPALARDVGKLFDVFWRWGVLVPGGAFASTAVFSPTFQSWLTVPTWEPTLPPTL